MEIIREQLAELERGLGRIEGKFDAYIKDMKKHDLVVERLDDRLRMMEDSRNKTIGAAGIIGALVGSVGGFLSSHLRFF